MKSHQGDVRLATAAISPAIRGWRPPTASLEQPRVVTMPCQGRGHARDTPHSAKAECLVGHGSASSSAS